MQKLLYLVLIVMLFTSCGDKKANNEKFLPDSSGAINNVSVVVEIRQKKRIPP